MANTFRFDRLDDEPNTLSDTYSLLLRLPPPHRAYVVSAQHAYGADYAP